MNKQDEKYIQDLITTGNALGATTPIEALIMAGYNDPSIDSNTIKILQEIADREFARLMKEETKKKPKTPEQEFYGYKSNPKKKGPSQLGNVSHDVLTNLAAKYFGPNVVNDKKLNEMKCPSGIKKIRYKGTLGGKDMMVCPRRSGSSSGGNGGNGN